VLPPASYLHTTITRQDYLVLDEGATKPAEESTRDVCIGVLCSSVVAAISIYATCDMTKHVKDGEKVINALIPGPCIACMIFVAAIVVSGLLAALTHKKAGGDAGRRSFIEVKRRLRVDLRIDDPMPDSKKKG
jgi:hypothetical protein